MGCYKRQEEEFASCGSYRRRGASDEDMTASSGSLCYHLLIRVAEFHESRKLLSNFPLQLC